jgi:hypothetical protein
MHLPSAPNARLAVAFNALLFAACEQTLIPARASNSSCDVEKGAGVEFQEVGLLRDCFVAAAAAAAAAAAFASCTPQRARRRRIPQDMSKLHLRNPIRQPRELPAARLVCVAAPSLCQVYAGTFLLGVVFIEILGNFSRQFSPHLHAFWLQFVVRCFFVTLWSQLLFWRVSAFASQNLREMHARA